MFKQTLSFKSKESNPLKVLIFGFILAFLVGCGGNDSSSNSVNDESLKAQFVDSPVAGLDYKTDTLSGVTDSNGSFEYSKDDEKVEFFVGNIKIGEFNLSKLNTDKKILPSELFGLDRNNTTDDRVIKVIRFLQSLDDDANVSNGITIDDLTKNNLTTFTETNDTVDKNLTENNITVIEDMLKGVGKTLMLENKARENYKKYLQNELNITPDFMPFITVWEVNESDLNITIPVNPEYLGEYNYTVDWGDGSVDKEVNDSITHTYATEGNYTVRITGDFPAIYFNGGLFDNYSTKIIKITRWGDIEWKDFNHSFAGCIILDVNATDTPDLTDVKNMNSMFLATCALKGNSSFNNWNVSNVTNMSCMFNNASSFNQSLNDWDVSNVTDMSGMFYFAVSFNQSLNNWNVSNVTNMSYMFVGASNFNQPLNDWNVSNVTDMSDMFSGATSFNQPLNDWNVSNVTDMRYMFYNAKSFDQNISMWDVSNVTDYDEFATGCPIDGTDKMPNFQ